MQLSDFLSPLDKVAQRGDQYTACCPAHDDKKPSLAITEKDNKILLKCWSGCTTQDIVGSMGLQLKDLFTDSNLSPSQRRHYAKKKNKHTLRQALAFELYMLLFFLNDRISDTECANDSKYKKARPEFTAMSDEPWERELQAVNLIMEILDDLYK